MLLCAFLKFLNYNSCCLIFALSLSRFYYFNDSIYSIFYNSTNVLISTHLYSKFLALQRTIAIFIFIFIFSQYPPKQGPAAQVIPVLQPSNPSILPNNLFELSQQYYVKLDRSNPPIALVEYCLVPTIVLKASFFIHSDIRIA